jgi:hypothetical protein
MPLLSVSEIRERGQALLDQRTSASLPEWDGGVPSEAISIPKFEKPKVKKMSTPKKTLKLAFLDETSGQNPNFPIRKFDTHPNAYFKKGDRVTYFDHEAQNLAGTVVGHAAEDRVWVDWGRDVTQEDVDDLIKDKEWKFNLLEPAEDVEVPEFKPTDGRRAGKTAFWSGAPNWLGGQGWQNRPSWMGGRGSYEQQYDTQLNQGQVPNQLRYPEIQNSLLKAGMNPRVLEQLAGALDKIQLSVLQRHQAQQQAQNAIINQQVQQGDWSNITKNTNPNQLQFGGDTFNGSNLKVKSPSTLPSAIPVAPPLAYYPQASPPVPMVASKAAAWRKAGLNELRFQANALEALGHPDLADTVKRAALVAASVSFLYRDPKTRKASASSESQGAIRTASALILATAQLLRDQKLQEPANSIENAFVASLTYER